MMLLSRHADTFVFEASNIHNINCSVTVAPFDEDAYNEINQWSIPTPNGLQDSGRCS